MLKVLHIDRSSTFRNVMRELVTRCTHSLVGVGSKADALRVLAEDNFELIVTGMELDDGDAESLILELNQSQSRNIPVIVLTSTDSLEQRERLFTLGVVDYMLKAELTEDRFRRYLDSLAVEDELSGFMRSLRVAVLDDSQVILTIVSRILSMNGFESVSLFKDPLDLLAQEQPYDLYICDMVMPNMSGEQVVNKLRSSFPDSIIICMSKFAGERPIANILLAGADDYIHKPFDAAGLMSRLRVNTRSFQLKKHLERMALTDGLTNLFNHRYSFERLEEETGKARRYSRPLSVAMADVDDFKRINDTYGHRKGDEVLVAVARSIKNALRSVDVVGRYGGEEFIVLFPETPLIASRLVAEKMRSAVAALRFEGVKLAVTISIGITEYEDAESSEALIARADALLYHAKRSGKNRVES